MNFIRLEWVNAILVCSMIESGRKNLVLDVHLKIGISFDFKILKNNLIQNKCMLLNISLLPAHLPQCYFGKIKL